MKIVCISDTHNHHREITIPEGDVLIHAGDFTSKYDFNPRETLDFNYWLGSLPHKHKIVIAGNHDVFFEKEPVLAQAMLTNAIYLENNGIVINNILFWGSPYTPAFANWAFNATDRELISNWNRIPDETDVLISHGPAYGVLDYFEDQHLGCPHLKNRIKTLPLKAHIFGHIHRCYGQENISVNAAQCDNENELVNKPIIIEV